MRKQRQRGQDRELKGSQNIKNFTYFFGEGSFTKEYTLQVNGEEITAQKIFICSGARPLIPFLKGIDSVDYLTNETVLELTKKPESMIIIGGGYIAAEYGHFFAAMGTKVTIIQRDKRLLPNQEPEISDLLKNQMEKRMEIVTNIEATEVMKHKKGYLLKGMDRLTKKEKMFTAQTLFIAAGRKSNADRLQVEKTGVELDSRGFIKVNEYLMTNKKNIWAFGDGIGKYMFKHVANREADLVWHNASHDHQVMMDYQAIPYAVFSHPQIASVGLTQAQAQKTHEILVGKAYYSDIAKGIAMMEQETFAKAILDRKTGQLLGFHIIGSEASILIQEVVNAMASVDRTPSSIYQGFHIHPALSELILFTLHNLREINKLKKPWRE